MPAKAQGKNPTELVYWLGEDDGIEQVLMKSADDVYIVFEKAACHWTKEANIINTQWDRVQDPCE